MKLKFAAIAVLSFLALFGSQAFGQNLVLNSFPSGAEVTIDGTDTGRKTPYNQGITAGSHTILLTPPNVALWQSTSQTVTIPSGGAFNLTISLVPVLTQGPIGPQGVQGPQGATGATGATGMNGLSATIQIGTADCGQKLSITNSGTNSNAIFNFEIPCAPLTGGTLSPDAGGGETHLQWFPLIGNNANSNDSTGIGTVPVNPYIVTSWTVTVSGAIPNTSGGDVSLIDQSRVDINTAGLNLPFVQLAPYVVQCQIGPNQSCTVQNDGTFLPLNPSDSYIVRIGGLSPGDANNIQITWSVQ